MKTLCEGAESVLTACLARSARQHDHLCPRQVLGVRMGLHAAACLGVPVPQIEKHLLAFVETDGCFADGVAAATGCSLGHRTLRLIDFGKVALTLADSRTGQAVRVWPHPLARTRANRYAPTAVSHWHAQLTAYATMPAEELLVTSPVRLAIDLGALISQPGLHVVCAGCGEEIMNGREVAADGRAICRACAGERYYVTNADMPPTGVQMTVSDATNAPWRPIERLPRPVARSR